MSSNAWACFRGDRGCRGLLPGPNWGSSKVLDPSGSAGELDWTQDTESVSAVLHRQLLTQIVTHKKEHVRGGGIRPSGPRASLTESGSDALGRNMDTREQRAVLLLGHGVARTPSALLVHRSVR